MSNTVDLIEINHCYDENGQLVFDQLLYYDWCPSQNRYNVRDWRLLKSRIQLPRRNAETGHYVAIWRDGPNIRKVYAKTVREVLDTVRSGDRGAGVFAQGQASRAAEDRGPTAPSAHGVHPQLGRSVWQRRGRRPVSDGAH